MSDFDLIYDGVKENYGVFPSQIIDYLEKDDNYYEAVLFDILLDIVTGSINPMKKFVEMLDKYSKLAKDSTNREQSLLTDRNKGNG
jgi:hypothetical protein